MRLLFQAIFSGKHLILFLLDYLFLSQLGLKRAEIGQFQLILDVNELILPIGLQIGRHRLRRNLIRLTKPEPLWVGRVLTIDLGVGHNRIMHIKWQHSLFSIRLKKLILNNGVESGFSDPKILLNHFQTGFFSPLQPYSGHKDPQRPKILSIMVLLGSFLPKL